MKSMTPTITVQDMINATPQYKQNRKSISTNFRFWMEKLENKEFKLIKRYKKNGDINDWFFAQHIYHLVSTLYDIRRMYVKGVTRERAFAIIHVQIETMLHILTYSDAENIDTSLINYTVELLRTVLEIENE